MLEKIQYFYFTLLTFKKNPSVKLLFTLLFMLLTAAASAQWNSQSPVPTHLDVRGIGAPGAQRVFIATADDISDDGGALFETNDGGVTWQQRNVPVSLSESFNGLFFLNSQLGWAYGNDNYRTVDGGTTWIQMPFLGSTYYMRFFTPSFGVAIGNFGIYVSIDGGVSWNPSPDNIYGYDFTGLLTGLGISQNAIYRTVDGGNTFTSVYTGSPEDIKFTSASSAVGIDDNTFIRSTDGGLTWTPGQAALGRNRLFVLSADVILAWGKNVTNDDRVLRSADGGITWTDLGEIIPEGILSFTSTGQNVIAADLSGNMFLSTDAGAVWTQTFTSPGPKPGVFGSPEPVFADAQTAYFAFGSGYIIKSTDAGTTWNQISSGTGETLQAIARFPGGSLIAIGENGTVLSSNGSSNWILHPKFTEYNLIALQILDNNNVFVLDQTGQLYKSFDGGNNWTAAASKPQGLSPATDLKFSTPSDGWILGQGFSTGVLFHTTDGGSTWNAATGFGGAYVALDVEGANIWAMNITGLYQRSTNGGNTWIQEFLPASPVQVTDVDFFDQNTGYAVSHWGYVFKSINGGADWTALTMPDQNINYTSIHLLSANELWLSSNNDKAYYTANGGESWAVMNIGSNGNGFFNSITSGQNSVWAAGYAGSIEYFAGPPPPPLNLPPVASFNYISNGLTINFTDTSFDPDGIIVSWEWDFGDNTGSTEQNPSHTYNAANTYIVKLTVTDDDGDSGVKVQFIVVQPNPGGTFGDFTEVTPLDSIFVTPQNEDFWVITTAPADYDGDGDLDIAVLGYYVVYNQSVEDRLLLLRNDGANGQASWNFTYISIPLGDLYTGASDLAWGDADGDGDLDLIVGTNFSTVLYKNDEGTLVMTDTELPPYYEDNFQADFDLRSITWADYDNDGDLDLFIPSAIDSSGDYYTALLRNDGPSQTGGIKFTDVSGAFPPTSHAQSAWADNDGDQDLDLLLVNLEPLTDNGFIRIYTNNGNGGFTGTDILGDMTIEHGEAHWGDYDGDGDLDILVAGHIKENGSYKMALRVYRNDASVYVPIEIIDCIPCQGWFDLTAAAWADYDSDGDMDILLAGTYNSGSQIEGRATIYKNNNGVFTVSDNELPAPRASGTRGGTFSWLDIDNDGDLDYFIAGQYFVPGGNGLVEAQMHIYRNDVEGENDAPAPPSELNAVLQSDNSVLLSWTAAVDDHTPSAALTYDLDLFRNGIPVNIPNRLPEPGNVSAVTEWLLSGLQDGYYNWTLRAVDAAYIGSSIASGEFYIGVSSVDDNTLPDVYSLAQNYPNPFNPVTSIKYSIPSEGIVTLKIYNTLGEEVAVIVDEFKRAGNYEVSFNASQLASAVYLYRLQSGNYVETKKMILIK